MTTNTNISKYAKLLAHIGAVLTVSVWATSFVCTKVLMEDGPFTPVEVYTYRFTLAYILLLSFTFRKILADNWKDELQFVLCGICAGSLYFITENYALKATTTGNVSLLASISPLFTTILMAIIFRTRIGWGEIIGSVFAFLGVGCIIFSGGQGLEIHPEGDLLALAAALSWAVYTIAVKRLMPLYSGFFITRKLFFYGVLTSLPLLYMQYASGVGMHISLLFTNWHYLSNLLFLVVLCSCFAYVVWNETMRVLGPVTSNNYLYGQPLVTMIVAYFVFGEQIYLLGYIGCALIIGGLVISDKLKIGKS